ncbi:MAG: hypothetical protein JWM74_1308, partial [Myxococcaceae bacterium]|nr:hypothetical protein [Myxococcaceae bacterium]
MGAAARRARVERWHGDCLGEARAARGGRAKEGARVDRFSFSVRRVFHRLGQLGVMVTEAYGLTPARFALMRAIDCQRQEWVAHRDVYELLGVRGPTVSRMVGKLEDRGYLERR